MTITHWLSLAPANLPKPVLGAIRRMVCRNPRGSGDNTRRILELLRSDYGVWTNRAIRLHLPDLASGQIALCLFTLERRGLIDRPGRSKSVARARVGGDY